jgi:CheY-like chemotaxis protein
MLRVLLVDDDPDVLEALELVLEDVFDTATATNGVEALRLLRAEAFDVVLLDMMMPVLDGEGVLDGLREEGITVPVLLGSAIPDLAEVSERLGVPALAKPYDLRRLITTLNQVASERGQGPTGGAPPPAEGAPGRGPPSGGPATVARRGEGARRAPPRFPPPARRRAERRSFGSGRGPL